MREISMISEKSDLTVDVSAASEQVRIHELLVDTHCCSKLSYSFPVL